MKIKFQNGELRPKPTVIGLLEWQRNDLYKLLLNGLYSAMEVAAKEIEVALKQAVDDAVEAFYQTYSPRAYKRTENLKRAYNIHCRFERSQEKIIIDGDEHPTIEFMSKYYSEADYGNGPVHRPLSDSKMMYIVSGLTESGVRFYPPWRNPPSDYPFKYGPISITFQLTKTKCTGMNIQELISGKDISKAIDDYLEFVVTNTALRIYYNYIDSCRDFHGWDIRFKED